MFFLFFVFFLFCFVPGFVILCGCFVGILFFPFMVCGYVATLLVHVRCFDWCLFVQMTERVEKEVLREEVCYVVAVIYCG